MTSYIKLELLKSFESLTLRFGLLEEGCLTCICKNPSVLGQRASQNIIQSHQACMTVRKTHINKTGVRDLQVRVWQSEGKSRCYGQSVMFMTANHSHKIVMILVKFAG